MILTYLMYECAHRKYQVTLFVIFLLTFLKLLFPFTIFAQSSQEIEWKPIGPQGVGILALVPHPTDPFTLYAVVDAHGIYKSSDGGETWQEKNQGIEGLTILSLAIADDEGKILYAGALYGGIFKSSDSGETWVSITKETSEEFSLETSKEFSFIFSLGVADNECMYAGVGHKGIYKSEDSGKHWYPINDTLPLKPHIVWSILIHPKFKDILYIATNQGTYKSQDGGKSWQQKNDYYTKVLTFGDSWDTIFGGGSQGLYFSEDGGESWNVDPASRHPASDGLWAVETLLFDGNSLYVGGHGGIYEVSEGQYKGNRNGTGLPEDGLVVRGIAKSGDRLYLGTGWGIFYSENNGDSWENVTNGLPQEGLIVKSITFGGGKVQSMYIGTWGGGIFKRENRKSLWESVNYGLSIPYITNLQVNDDVLYAMTSVTSVVTGDRGKTWKTFFTYNSLEDINFSSFKFDHCEKIRVARGDRLFASINGFKQTQDSKWKRVCRLITSQDQGRKWQAVFLDKELGEDYDVIDVVVNLKKNQIVYVIYSTPKENGVLISEDSGKIWTKFNQGLGGEPIYSLTVGGEKGNILLVATATSIYRRENGENWKQIILGPYNKIIADPYRHERIYALNNEGAFIFSQDLGQTWTTAGFADVRINDLAIEPNNSNFIYAATEGQSVLRANVESLFPKPFNWTLYIIAPSSVLTLLIVVIFFLYHFKKEKFDPLEISKQFFGQAGFEWVEPLPNKVLHLHVAKNKMPGMATVWYEGRNIQSLANTVRQYTEQSDKKFKLYLVHTEQKLATQDVQHLRKLIRCEIIPVQVSHLARILKTQSKEGIIRRLKGLEAPFLTRLDPYADFKPIHDPTWFYGRDEFMKRLPVVLAQGQHVGIFGLRKVGKTSLIRQIQQRFVTTPTIYMDSQAFSPKADIYFDEILKRLHTELRTHNIKSLPVYQRIQDIEDFRHQFLNLFTHWKKAGQHEPFLLIFDEIDKFFPNRKLKNSEAILSEYVCFFKVLRGLAQTHQCLVTLVVAYRPDINRHNLLAETIGENPMFKSFREEFLGFLTLPESTTMIHEIGRWKDITWEDDAAQKVFYYCGGHPLVTRYFASRACEKGSLKHVTLEKVEHTAEHIRKTFHKNDIGNYYKEGVWDLMFGEEQEVLVLIGQAEGSNVIESHIPAELEDALTNLEHFGLVVHKQRKLRLTADLFASWLKRRLGI